MKYKCRYIVCTLLAVTVDTLLLGVTRSGYNLPDDKAPYL